MRGRGRGATGPRTGVGKRRGGPVGAPGLPARRRPRRGGVCRSAGWGCARLQRGRRRRGERDRQQQRRPAPRPSRPTTRPAPTGSRATSPVTTEETLTDLTVTGSIPPELSGLFVRNGSNPPSGRSLHWFLGDGMIHGVRLEGGRARWYRNRYVQTPLAVAGKDLLEFGGVPGRENNQSNVALIHHGQAAQPGRGGLALRAGDRRPGDHGALGLRRPPGRHHDRPPEDRPGHRPAALLRLRVPAAGAHLLRPTPTGASTWSAPSRSRWRR